MSRMIPKFISPEIKSAAERKVFGWFRDAPGTDDWIVLHSMGVANHRNLIYGEIDFVVLAPQYGVFALEVKGGGVSRIDGIWHFTDRYGKIHTKPRGPFEQASSGIFSVTDAIKKKFGPDSRLSKLFFASAVMFPDIVFNLDEIDAHQWQIFDQRDGEDVKRFIHKLATNTYRQWEEKYGQFYKDKIPDRKDIKDIAHFLRGDFDMVVSLGVNIKTIEEDLIRLTGEQTKCLDQLEDNPRCLIEGAAGTGKTLLALEAAKKSALNGENVIFFCYNKMLGEWLNEYMKKENPSLRPSYTGCLHQFIFQITDKAGMPFVEKENAETSFWNTDMPLAAIEAAEKLDLKYDRIIVDEAQDLLNENYLEVFDLILRGGIERGKWIFFGDFSQQAIFSNIPEEEMKALLDSRTAYVKFRLRTNCRNTKPITGEITSITGFDRDSLNVKTEGPPVTFYQWKDMDDQKIQVENLLVRLKKESISPSMITILAPVKRDRSVVPTLGITVKDYHPGEIDAITFSTIQAFKGLENAVIIITDITTYRRKLLMYTGLSRARGMLVIFESDNAHKERSKLKSHAGGML